MSERLETLKKARARMVEDRDAFAKTLAAPFDRDKAERARLKFIETQAVIDAICSTPPLPSVGEVGSHRYPSRVLNALAGEHGLGREQPLAAGARALEIVEELERAVAQFQDRHVGRRADIEGAAIIE
jgi:hypothetical protein